MELNSSIGFRNIINKDLILGGLFPINDCTGIRKDVDMK